VFDHFLPDRQKLNLVLFKLHGSTSWYRDPDKPESVRKFDATLPELAGSRAVLIYPTQVKTEGIREEPFRTAYEYFRETLYRAKLCIVGGSSFRDPAVNEILRGSLVQNSDLKLVVVEPEMSKLRGDQFRELSNKLSPGEDWERKLRVIVGKFGEHPRVDEELVATIKGLDQWDNLDSWVNARP
jgi:hypothetical protein